jgi:hypothetical protein
VRCRGRERRGWAALTRVLQSSNQIGDDGAQVLGEVLKVNCSLRILDLVRRFLLLDVFVAGVIPLSGREGGGLHLRVRFSSVAKSAKTVLESWARG